MRQWKKAGTMTQLSFLLFLGILLPWGSAMLCLTCITAQEFYERLYYQSQQFIEQVEKNARWNEWYDEKGAISNEWFQQRPDAVEYYMLCAIEKGANQEAQSDPGIYSSAQTGRKKWIRDVSEQMETAVLFYDGQGNLLHSSEEDILFFAYYTQEEWAAGKDSTAGLHYGWIDMSKKIEGAQSDPYSLFREAYRENNHLWKYPMLRVQGYFEGNQLHPVKMEWTAEEKIDEAVSKAGGYTKSLSALDNSGFLEWSQQFDYSQLYSEADLVTIYIDRPKMWETQEEELTFAGKKYKSLSEFARKRPLTREAWKYDSVEYGTLQDLWVLQQRNYANDKEGTPEKEAEIEWILVTAARSNPLQLAVSSLRNIYLITGALAVGLMIYIRNHIKKGLVEPVAEVAQKMGSDWQELRWEERPKMGKEVEDLCAGYSRESYLHRNRANKKM